MKKLTTLMIALSLSTLAKGQEIDHDEVDRLKVIGARAMESGDNTTAAEALTGILDLVRGHYDELDSGGRDFIRNVRKYAVMSVQLGIDDGGRHENGLPGKWHKLAVKLDPPDPPTAWGELAAYHMVQYHLADYYMRKSDFARAQWHFALGETYYEKFADVATGDILRDQGIWRNREKPRLEQLIEGKGVRNGMLVQNNAFLQKWIGKVVRIDQDEVKVRITYSSASAPRGIDVGKTISFSRDELRPVKSLSIDAATKGYR